MATCAEAVTKAARRGPASAALRGGDGPLASAPTGSRVSRLQRSRADRECSAAWFQLRMNVLKHLDLDPIAPLWPEFEQK